MKDCKHTWENLFLPSFQGLYAGAHQEEADTLPEFTSPLRSHNCSGAQFCNLGNHMQEEPKR